MAELVLVPSDGGRFEVYVDGELIHSKLATGDFPEAREVIRAVEKRGRR